MREGADFLKEQLDKANNGTLFVDDCHALDGSSKEGRTLVMQLMHAAEDLRDTTTIILAGYKEAVEEKVFAADEGFRSHFSCLTFDDMTFDELKSIMWSLVRQHEWTVEDSRVVDVAARRVSRGSGTRGFANARSRCTLLACSSLRGQSMYATLSHTNSFVF